MYYDTVLFTRLLTVAFTTVVLVFEDVDTPLLLSMLYSGFRCLLESAGFFKCNFHDLESPGKWFWSWKILEIQVKGPGIYFGKDGGNFKNTISRTWEVLKNDFGPGNSWKFKLVVLEFIFGKVGGNPVYYIFFLSFCSSFLPKFVLASRPWKQVWSSLNFDTQCPEWSEFVVDVFFRSLAYFTRGFRSSNVSHNSCQCAVAASYL